MLDTIVHAVEQDPVSFILLILLIISEVLGSMDRFKSSSVFQLLITVLKGMLAKTRFGNLLPTMSTPDPSKDPASSEVTTNKDSSNSKDQK